jgi:hypothetical protein
VGALRDRLQSHSNVVDPFAAGAAAPARADIQVLAATWLIAAAYLAIHIRSGWIPHDEGTIAHSAERALMGQLPHRDFVDLYTGGLTFLHAAAFRVLGISLLVPRLVLYGFALVWLPAVYWIARRFLEPVGAAGVTLAAVAWSLPHYFTALPSWYNLFFATFMAAGLLRFVETDRVLYLFLAGLAAGLSVTFKVSGLFAVAAGLLSLLYIEAGNRPRNSAEGVGSRHYAVLLSVILIGFLTLLLLLLRSQAGLEVLFHFFVPALAATGLIGWIEWAGGVSRTGERLARTLKLIAPFAAGAAVPLAAFVVPYAAVGAVGNLVDGVFIRPAQRLTDVAWLPPPLLILLPALAIIAVLLWRLFGRLPPRRAAAWGVILLLVFGLAPGVALVWVDAAQAAIPVVVAAGAALVAKQPVNGAVPATARVQAGILILVLSLCTLIQFPYAYRIYFLYVAPLLALVLAAVYRLIPRPPRAVAVGVLAFSTAFGSIWLNHRNPYGGLHYNSRDAEAELTLGRAGGLRVSEADAAVYDRVVALLQTHAENDYAYAGPDAPEVYFLSGLTNPTPYLFEFFTRSDLERDLARAMDSLAISVIAINRAPQFTRPFSDDFMGRLQQVYPNAEAVGKYVVRWR